MQGVYNFRSTSSHVLCKRTPNSDSSLNWFSFFSEEDMHSNVEMMLWTSCTMYISSLQFRLSRYKTNLTANNSSNGQPHFSYTLTVHAYSQNLHVRFGLLAVLTGQYCRTIIAWSANQLGSIAKQAGTLQSVRKPTTPGWAVQKQGLSSCKPRVQGISNARQLFFTRKDCIKLEVFSTFLLQVQYKKKW